MFCQHCGSLVPEGMTFCLDCTKRMHEQQASAAPGDAYAGQQPVHPPPVSDYLGQQSTQPQYAAPTPVVAARRSAQNARLAAGLAWGSLAAGVLIIATTFLPWISGAFEVVGSPSGWTFMTKNGEMALGGNFIWIKIPGFLYFSGLWSILAGLGIIAGAVMLLMGVPHGRLVAGIAAVIGVGASTVNIIMTYNYQLSTGIGIWIFALMSVASVIGVEFAYRYSA